MRNVLKSAEVFHFWANKVQPSGRCGNTSFDRDNLYSYNAIIAKHLPDGSIAVATRSWSMTTSGHQSAARRAIPIGTKVIYVYDFACIQDMLASASSQINGLLEKASVARSKKDDYLGQAKDIADNFNAYSLATGSVLQIKAELPVGSDLSAIKQAIKDRQAAELAEKQRQERVAAERRASTLQGWRDGNPDARAWMLSGVRVALRINGDEVETTRGASIPVADAKSLWPIIQRCIRGDKCFTPGQPLGHYRLTRIHANGSIIVGCHHIDYTEIEAIARQLGLVEQDEAVAA